MRLKKLELMLVVLIAVVMVLFLNYLNVARSLGKYDFHELIVSSPNRNVLFLWASDDWYVRENNDSQLMFEVRDGSVSPETISVSFFPDFGDNRSLGYPTPALDKLMMIVGVKMQTLIMSGFEIGDGTGHSSVGEEKAYKFELIHKKLERYIISIITWRDGWYSVDYCNFGDTSPGMHYSDFTDFVEKLKFKQT